MVIGPNLWSAWIYEMASDGHFWKLRKTVAIFVSSPEIKNARAIGYPAQQNIRSASGVFFQVKSGHSVLGRQTRFVIFYITCSK
jgi:hypothetical protein